MLSLPLSHEAAELEISLIEKIAAVNNLTIDVRLLMKRRKLHSLLNGTRSFLGFSKFCGSELNAPSPPSPPPPPPPPQRKVWIRLPYLGKPTEMLEKKLKRYNYTGWIPSPGRVLPVLMMECCFPKTFVSFFLCIVILKFCLYFLRDLQFFLL